MTELEEYMEEKEKQNIRKTWRRVRTALVWAVLNVILIILQPLVGLDQSLVDKFLDKSTWIAGLLIVGLSGTNAIISYVNNRK